ncbi:MAG: 3-dehydroquinate synthase [Phycisphaerae bacterium]
MQTVRVDLGERSYDVCVAPALLEHLGEKARAAAPQRRAVVIADETVASLYGRAATESLSSAGMDAELLTFPAGERNKTLATYSSLMDELFALGPPVDRRTLIVALGGGVTGDLAGFVAATALRGLPWLQCPTTLLADVDASVGGKTAVDHPAGKNLIGAFHQPSGVVIDVNVLRTLPADELRGGLSECVKHGVIRDESLLGFIETNAEKILACDPDVMTELISRNVAIKAAVVAEDEREAGTRAHLNFGHTIGHGIEAAGGYGGLSHGQAVALGMVAECRIAVERGMLGESDADRVTRLLMRLGLPVRRAGLDAQEVWGIMQHDKKVLSGQVRMVLPSALGRVDVYDDIKPDEVTRALELLRNSDERTK